MGFYTLNYLEGIDYISDTIDVLIQLGAILQRGSYYDIINPDTGEVLYNEKIQGKPNLIKVIKENKELFKKLEALISYN